MDVQNQKGELSYKMYDENAKEATSETVCVAKEGFSDATNKTTYWVRQSTNGMSPGSLLDVRDNLKSLDAKDNIRGTLVYPFSKVTQTSFEEYLQFLRTRNGARLTLAERYRNGDN